MKEIKKILCPTDVSEASYEVVRSQGFRTAL
jgi:hypothetical protein